MLEATFLRTPRRIAFSLVGACAGWFVSPALAGDWTITPSITAQESFTDNVFLTPTNRRSDFITSVSPGISVTGESARLQGTFNYSPTLSLFALTPSQDFLGHNLFANGNATIVQDLFFLDARGYMSVLPNSPALTTGFLAPALAPALPSVPSAIGPSFINAQQGIGQNQLSQVSSFSASPYLAHRFDGFGSAELRYTVSDTNFSGLQSNNSAPPGFAAQNTNALTNEATASFLTGENLGRFQARFLLDTAQSSGTGVFNNANQTIEVVDSGYAISRSVTALASIGHEDLRFSGTPPTHFDDIIWGLGTRLTPSPDVTLFAEYGHRNGVTAPSFSLVYNITGRTTLSVNYTEGLSTVAQELANNLAIANLNEFGQAVDARTGVPLLLINPVLGLQTGVFRTKQLTGTATTAWERDRVTAFIYHYDNAIIAQSTAGTGVSQTTTGANLAYSHDLNPLTTANVVLGYSHENLGSPTNITATNTTANLFNLGLSVSHALNPTLTSWASYSFIDRTSSQAQLRVAANVITVGISKSF